MHRPSVSSAGASPPATSGPRARCVALSMLAVILTSPPPARAQACNAAGYAGLAFTGSSLPLGNFREDPSRGPNLGLDLGCDVGGFEVGIRPEVAAMGSIMAWSFLGSVAAPVPRVPWLRLAAVGGLLLADDGIEGVNVVFPGPKVHVPQAGPLVGGSLRVAIPASHRSALFIEGSLRVGFLDQVIEPSGDDDGARTLIYWPVTVGYSIGI